MLIRGLASIGRWDGTTFITREGAHYSGDAISDIRTRNNTLSVWYMSTAIEENDAIVAMCLNRNSLDKFVYVKIDEKELDEENITYQKALGRSDDVSKPEILEQHRDLTNLDYDQLGIIARIIHKKVVANKSTLLSSKKVAKLIVDAIKVGKVKYNNKNAVIVDSYDLLNIEKPIEDAKSVEESLMEKDTIIQKLSLKLKKLEENNKALSEEVENLKNRK